MSPNRFNQIDTIKEEFIQEWNSGQNPTLTAYLNRYPEFSEELTQFVMAFALLHAVPLEPSEPSEEARQAMLRGLSAGQTKARTVAARLKEIGLTDELARLNEPPESDDVAIVEMEFDDIGHPLNGDTALATSVRNHLNRPNYYYSDSIGRKYRVTFERIDK